MASVDAHTAMGNAQPSEQHAVSVARRTTGFSNVEALGGGTVCQDGHPPQEGQSSRDKEDTVESHSTKAGDKEDEEAVTTRTILLPKDQVLDGDVEETSHIRPFPSQLLVILQDYHTLLK